MTELRRIPERNRTDAEWDELNELEIRFAPGNRADQSQRGGNPNPAKAGNPRKQQGPNPNKNRVRVRVPFAKQKPPQ